MQCRIHQCRVCTLCRIRTNQNKVLTQLWNLITDSPPPRSTTSLYTPPSVLVGYTSRLSSLCACVHRSHTLTSTQTHSHRPPQCHHTDSAVSISRTVQTTGGSSSSGQPPGHSTSRPARSTTHSHLPQHADPRHQQRPQHQRRSRVSGDEEDVSGRGQCCCC